MPDDDLFFEALKADALHRWAENDRLTRYRWLCRLEQRPAPTRAFARAAKRVIARRAEEFRQLRVEAASVMSLGEAVAVLQAGGHDMARLDDARYVMEAHARPGDRKGGEPRTSLDDIRALVDADMFHDLPEKKRSRLIQALRMNARSEIVANGRLARSLLGILDVPVNPPPKPRLNQGGTPLDKKRLAKLREGLVRKQVLRLYDEMFRKNGNTVVKEYPPTRYAAAMEMVANGEAVIVRDEVRRPTRGRPKRGEAEMRERRVVTIGLTGKVPAGNEDRI